MHWTLEIRYTIIALFFLFLLAKNYTHLLINTYTNSVIAYIAFFIKIIHGHRKLLLCHGFKTLCVRCM